jgi:hypothetical protein
VASAIGGILLIQDTERLLGSRNFGSEALEVLLKAYEDNKELVIALRGEPEAMKRLIDSSPGVCSRFNTILDFTDNEDLTVIAAAKKADDRGRRMDAVQQVRQRLHSLGDATPSPSPTPAKNL